MLADSNVQVGINSFVGNTARGCGKNSYSGLTSIAAWYANIIQPLIEEHGSGVQPFPWTAPPPPTTTTSKTKNPPPRSNNNSPPPQLPKSPTPTPIRSPPDSVTPNRGEETAGACLKYDMEVLTESRYDNVGTLIRAAFVSVETTCTNSCLYWYSNCVAFNYDWGNNRCYLFTKAVSQMKLKADPESTAGYRFCANYEISSTAKKKSSSSTNKKKK
jgi:hypothetical protein